MLTKQYDLIVKAHSLSQWVLSCTIIKKYQLVFTSNDIGVGYGGLVGQCVQGHESRIGIAHVHGVIFVHNFYLAHLNNTES
jgi:hypothetical protein